MKSMNCMKVFVVGALSTGLLSSTVAIQAVAQELPKVYDASMPRQQQITLAESAAPAEVSSQATIYVLGSKRLRESARRLQRLQLHRWPAFRKAHRNNY
jgi:hypothetical protein